MGGPTSEKHARCGGFLPLRQVLRPWRAVRICTPLGVTGFKHEFPRFIAITADCGAGQLTILRCPSASCIRATCTTPSASLAVNLGTLKEQQAQASPVLSGVKLPPGSSSAILPAWCVSLAHRPECYPAYLRGGPREDSYCCEWFCAGLVRPVVPGAALLSQ